jgi:hypothetical protein
VEGGDEVEGDGEDEGGWREVEKMGRVEGGGGRLSTVQVAGRLAVSYTVQVAGRLAIQCR